MDERIEGLLLQLAGSIAPELVRTYDRAARIEPRTLRLARSLANYGLLVILADQPFSLQSVGRSVNQQIEHWVQGYAQMYHLLCHELFPSFDRIRAQHTDDRWPVLIALKGEAIPVMQRLAGYVAPYVARRQLTALVSEAELIGLMEVILDELDAASLPPDTYRRLRSEGVGLLRLMLAADLRHLALTDFDRPLFSDSQRLTATPAPKPPAPPELPATRQGDTAPLSTTQAIPGPRPEPPLAPQDSGSVPVFFKRDPRPAEPPPRPPLRPLPKKDDSGS